MARRSSRRPSRLQLRIRAPQKGTLVIACTLYIVGLFGVLGFIRIPDPYPDVALALAGGLLILGALFPGI
ncbi:MAG: hypothetical protein GX620_12090 [Chloroflexi bacterium]|nr:hypothetical protein [Chloroflexota bacterium]